MNYILPGTAAVKRARVTPSYSANTASKPGKRSASPPQGLSKSREVTGQPKAGTALTLSNRKKSVREQVSPPRFHSPWNHSSAPQIGINEHKPPRYHQLNRATHNLIKPKWCWSRSYIILQKPLRTAPASTGKDRLALADTLRFSPWCHSPKRSTSHRPSTWLCSSQLQ